MGKLFVIMGKSATGKDSLYQRIVEDFPKLQEVVHIRRARSVPGRPMAKSIFLSVKKKCTRCGRR